MSIVDLLPAVKFANTYFIHLGRERGDIRVKYFAQEYNTLPFPGLQHELLDPDSSALINNKTASLRFVIGY